MLNLVDKCLFPLFSHSQCPASDSLELQKHYSVMLSSKMCFFHKVRCPITAYVKWHNGRGDTKRGKYQWIVIWVQYWLALSSGINLTEASKMESNVISDITQGAKQYFRDNCPEKFKASLMLSFTYLQTLRCLTVHPSSINRYKPDEKTGEGRQREKAPSTLIWLKRNNYDHIYPSCTLLEEWRIYSVYSWYCNCLNVCTKSEIK